MNMILEPHLPVNNPERRKSPRLSGEFQADVVILSGDKPGDTMAGRVINVSREGVGLIMSATVPVGTQLSLVIYLDDYDSLCVANVVWRSERDGEIHYGLRVSDWSYIDPLLEGRLALARNT